MRSFIGLFFLNVFFNLHGFNVVRLSFSGFGRRYAGVLNRLEILIHCYLSAVDIGSCDRWNEVDLTNLVRNISLGCVLLSLNDWNKLLNSLDTLYVGSLCIVCGGCLLVRSNRVRVE